MTQIIGVPMILGILGFFAPHLLLNDSYSSQTTAVKYEVMASKYN